MNDFFYDMSNIFQQSALDSVYSNGQGISITKNLTVILKATMHKDLAIKSFAAQRLVQGVNKTIFKNTKLSATIYGKLFNNL